MAGTDEDKELKNFITTISYLKSAGDAHVNKQNYPSAIQYYNNALSYLEKFTQQYLNEIRTKSTRAASVTQEQSKLSSLFLQSKQFREEIYLNLMGNTSLCLMKLDKHRDASRYLERMIALGSNKLKFYLRLAVCYENLDQVQKALDLLENKARRVRALEKDQSLLRKSKHLISSLKLKLRKEESHQDDLFRRCFDLKNNSTTEWVPHSKSVWYRRWLGYLGRACLGVLLGLLSEAGLRRLAVDAGLAHEVGYSLANLCMGFSVGESFARKNREAFVVNGMVYLAINAVWLRALHKR